MLYPEDYIHNTKGNQKIDGTVDKAYTWALSYLYYNGAITLTKSFNNNSMPLQFKIPNKVIGCEFMQKLNDIFGAQQSEFAKLVVNPTADDLKDLLTSLVAKAPNLFRNNRTDENKLQDHLVTGMKYVLSLRREAWITPFGTEKGKGRRCDLILLLPDNKAAIIELKRIRHNAILLEGVGGHIDYNEDDFAFVESRLNDFSDTEIKNIQIRPLYTFRGMDTVEKVQNGAKTQLEEYMGIARQHEELKNRVLIGFSVVQVGFDRFLVEEVRE